MVPPARPLRCLAVAGLASAMLAGLAAFLLPDLEATLAVTTTAVAGGGRPGGAGAASFDVLLVHGCATLALLAAAWLWTVACTVALQAARGRAAVEGRGVPAAVRRGVLVACGVALAGAVAAPAGATTGLGGLPVPDRATGAAHAPVVVRVAPVPAARRAPTGVPGTTPVTARRDVVVVRPGDTLWDLAQRHLPPGADTAEVTACWHRIHELNRAVVGDDPDLIRPGQRLLLPPR